MKVIQIFCDGGLGNRINTLVSGLAAAKLLELEPAVFWPANNWCRATFDQVFDCGLRAEDRTLSDLAGQMQGLLPLLHDQHASQKLGIDFASAYAWPSIAALKSAAHESARGLFYYPALIPAWLPAEALHETLASLHFHPDLREAAMGFIREHFSTPSGEVSFYGLHLRRTDLTIGYSDAEVGALASSHPESKFFVCSDDPLSERIACAHGNVFARQKAFHVDKKDRQGKWNDATLDDEQRLYYSNIERGAEQVREAAIDLLVLAHSTILGFSGSTFQATARLIGQVAALLQTVRPPDIPFLAEVDCMRQLVAGRLSMVDVIGLGEQFLAQGRADAAIRFLQAALNQYPANQAFAVHYNLSWSLMNAGRHGEAEIFVQQALSSNPAFPDTYVMAAKIALVRGDRARSAAHLDRVLAMAAQEPDEAKRRRLEILVQQIRTEAAQL